MRPPARVPALGAQPRQCRRRACFCALQGPGPNGGKTLCATCSSRFRHGHSSLPPTDASGRYHCERCERTFESFRALGVHTRDCDGGSWRCSWCACKADETNGKGPGPDGPRTLCSACAQRYRSGAARPANQVACMYMCMFVRAIPHVWMCSHTSGCVNAHGRACSRMHMGVTLLDTSRLRFTVQSCTCSRPACATPPLAPQDAFGQFPCDRCGRPFESISGLGVHRRHCSPK